MEQEAKRGLTNLEFLCKRQLIDKVKENEKLLSAQVTRFEKAKRNLQSQREHVKELNNEMRRLKLENKHLQTVLIRETDGEEQDTIEILMNDFRDEMRNSMSLEHSLMVTKWELTEKIEDLKDLSEQVKEKDQRYKKQMEQIKIQIQDLEARAQRNREWIDKRESALFDAKDSVLQLEKELQEKDRIIENLKYELNDREKIIEDFKDEFNKFNSTEKVSVSTNANHDVQAASLSPSWSSIRWVGQVMVKNIIYLQKHLY